MMSKRPIKVLQVVHALGMGGAETWLMELLRLWSKTREVHMDFLMTGGKPGLFDDEATQLGAKLHYVEYGRKCLPQFAKQFRRVLGEGGYHAIHDHQDYVSGWHFLLGGSALPPVRVTHVHNPAYQIRNNYGVTLGRRLTAQIGKGLVARHATHIAGTSRQMITEYGFDAASFQKIPKAALYCGVDTSRFASDAGASKAAVCREFAWPDNAKIILVAGRLDQSSDFVHPQNHKNSAFALSVGIECISRDSNVRLLSAGALSPAVSRFEERVTEAGFVGRIRFVGVRNDIERLMLASDVLLFPSRGEGLGMVAVEAQAAGLPVLASTAVPRECVVLPDLVRFLSLEAGEEQWATDVLQLAAQTRDIQAANQRVAASAFAIGNSAQALLKLYGDGMFA